MKHPERVEDYLEHIATAIQRATEYTDHLGSVSAFRVSQRDQDAVIRNIEIIGESARQIQKNMPEFVTAHPELPWTDMSDMRNKMIHNYFDVDLEIVWQTLHDDLPTLKHQIDNLLKERQPDSGAEKKAAWSRQHAETEQSIQQRKQDQNRDRER